jgi:ABC-type transport system involved in multi-copper enzyme maturation permease subunit
MWSLLWKEWHEQSWKLGFGSLTLAALAWIGLRSRIIADETMVLWVCFIGVMLLPILSSTGLVPAERSEGSFESLLALPVSPWRILLAKTVMGLVLCLGPLAAALAASLAAAGGRELEAGAMVEIYACSMLATVSLFFWMMALTVRLPTETRAALLGLGVLMLWGMVTGSLQLLSLPPAVMAISPLSSFMALGGSSGDVMPSLPWMDMAVQAVVVCLLWGWTCRQLTRPVEN